MIYIGTDPRGQLVPPNARGSSLISLDPLPPIFSLASTRITTRLALDVPTGVVKDVALFLLLPSKYVLQSFMGFDASIPIASCVIRLRTAAAGGGTVVSALTATGMAPGEGPKLGTVPNVGMLTDNQLFVRVENASTLPATVSLLLQILDLTPGEVTTNQWQSQSL